MIKILVPLLLLSTTAFAKDLASIPRKEMPKAIEQMLQASPKTKAFAIICDEKTCAVMNIAEEK